MDWKLLILLKVLLHVGLCMGFDFVGVGKKFEPLEPFHQILVNNINVEWLGYHSTLPEQKISRKYISGSCFGILKYITFAVIN